MLKIHTIGTVPKYIKQLVADFSSKKLTGDYLVLYSELCDWLMYACSAASWHISAEYFQKAFAILQGVNLNVLQTLWCVSLPLEGTFLLLQGRTSQGMSEK